MNTKLEPMDRGFRILLWMLDDATQQDVRFERKIESPSYDDALAVLQADYDKMKAENPTDDRFGFTMFQQITINIFGKVTRQWEPCAWFGSNVAYLVGKPTALDENGYDQVDRDFIAGCMRIAASMTRYTPFVPSLPLL